MSLTVAVTGAGGQLGRALLDAHWPDTTDVIGLGSDQLDITDRSQVERVLDEIRPQVVVNTAAYTAVDDAESEPERAQEVNGVAVGHLVESCDRLGATLVHISTDYVFDGTRSGRYREDDPTGPLGAYGRSKELGERIALAARRSVVVRISWLYSDRAPNFVATMLRLANERSEIGVVDDQRGCPTSARSAAAGLVKLVRASAQGRAPGRVYHLASPDDASWYDLARAALDASSHASSAVLHRLDTSQYPTAARRPANSCLDSTRAAIELGIVLPSWRTEVPAAVAGLERLAL